ncbi:hypothetical protein HDA40_003862 [Hamadaea flava]|uniref:Uncharacterized protein n=1 Tax=Hamadaea flava TaxID=1742688 RepID=A0ABV8LHU1_9ACTN|nr:hypothetical protein [Hamadaea flava]MCP2325355.1 hypothetical protein [Hamadaea flava]
MKRLGLWGAVPAALAAGAALVLLLAWSSPRGDDEAPAGYLLGLAAVSGPWMVAAAILWYAASRWVGVRMSGVDGPARVLALAVATLPTERRDWGAAMTAELEQVTTDRWRFALGCTRTALFPPRGNRAPALVVAGGTVVLAVVTALVVHRALPGMRLFAVVFVGIVGLLATVGVARSWRVRRPGHAKALMVVGGGAVAAGVGVTGYDLSRDPAASLGTGPAVWLALLLGMGLWLSVAPPRSLTTSRLARWTGLGAGVTLAATVFVAARTNDGGGILFVPLVVSIGVVLVAALVVARLERSFAAGLQSMVWTVTIAGLLGFAIWVFEAMRWSAAHGTSLLDGAAGGGHVRDAIVWILFAVPLVALPFGVIGAAVGSLARR